MFRNTRLKLTTWYLVLIMFISFVFSVVIFVNVNRELSRFEHFQSIRQERLREEVGDVPVSSPNIIIDQQLIYESRDRLLASLIILNILVLACAGIAGYFLAGRTLNPIKRALEDQARFIGDASHELKTPLTALRSEIEVYLRSKDHKISEADEILKSNLEEVVRLQSLSNNLMELTTLGKVNQKLHFEKLSLMNILQEAIKNVTPMANAKDIKILLKPTKSSIYANAKSISQLFTVLVDNAIKYSHNNSKVTVSTNVTGGVASIKIADQGIGIAQSELEHIFDRFYRVDKSRSSFDVPGYGLGLAIAKEIVTLHSGAISVKSNSKGSVFTVELPV